jgi:hypothetical protein
VTPAATDQTAWRRAALAGMMTSAQGVTAVPQTGRPVLGA